MGNISCHTRRVFDKMVRTSGIGRHLDTAARKNAVLDVMAKHHIVSDKMPSHKMKAFLRDLSSKHLGCNGKKVLESFYQNSQASLNNKPSITFKTLNFASNGGIREAQQSGLIVKAHDQTPAHYDSKNVQDVEIRERLKRIET